MNGKEFLQAVWPDQGHYCIATPAISKTGNHYYKHYDHNIAKCYCRRLLLFERHNRCHFL